MLYTMYYSLPSESEFKCLLFTINGTSRIDFRLKRVRSQAKCGSGRTQSQRQITAKKTPLSKGTPYEYLSCMRASMCMYKIVSDCLYARVCVF